MATITPTYEQAGIGGIIATWAAMANGDVGAPAFFGARPDKSLTVQGTFGIGGNCRLQAAHVPPESAPAAADWQTCADPNGNALNITVASMEQILEHAAQYRPNITAGDGATSLTVRIFAYARPR